MKGKVLIASPVHPVLFQGLKDLGYELVVTEQITQEEAMVQLADCVGVVTSTRLLLDRRLLDAAPALRWIGRMGSGMEVIDVPYAMEKGIVCFSSPEGNANAVAEHAVGLLISLTKKIGTSHQEVKQGHWLREENRGTELEGKTLGIIGFGHTGRALARKLSGFDMQLLAFDKYHRPADLCGAQFCDSLDRIFREATILSFHVPLKDDTIYYLNDAFIERMEHQFLLINTSRGAVVETAALLGGLASGKILGAGLDVLEEEPLQKMNPVLRARVETLLGLPQVIITPHIAGYSNEALFKMSKVLLERIVTVP